jgi:hypothetical protein
MLGLYYFRVRDDQAKSDIYPLLMIIIANQRNMSQTTYAAFSSLLYFNPEIKILEFILCQTKYKLRRSSVLL